MLSLASSSFLITPNVGLMIWTLVVFGALLKQHDPHAALGQLGGDHGAARARPDDAGVGLDSTRPHGRPSSSRSCRPRLATASASQPSAAATAGSS